jgi:hypothetical protein
MKVLVGALGTDPEDAVYTEKVISAILADHREAGKGRATRIARRDRESSRGCWHVIQPREGALH